MCMFSRFTEIFVSELEDTGDLKTLVVDYLQGLSPNAAIVDGIVRLVLCQSQGVDVEQKVFVVHRGRYNNNKVYYHLSHGVAT